MSKYTITVDELIDINFDFGLDKYPIFDEDYRPVLNNAILEHYRFREIGWQNPIQWRNRLQNRMNIIMRNKYNALYKAKSIDFNPLYNVDMTETYTHKIDNTVNAVNKLDELNENVSNSDTVVNTSSNATSNDSSENSGLNLTSNFPSEQMTEDDYTDNVYVDGATKANSSATNESESDVSSNTKQVDVSTGNNKRNVVSNDEQNHSTIETYERKTVGSSAGLPFSRAMQQLKDFYDDYLLDQQVIDELKDLFISIW